MLKLPNVALTLDSSSSFFGTDATLLPKPTNTGVINGSDVWVYKYAEGTRLDCALYANGTDFGRNPSCADVARGYGVNETDLPDWNLSLRNSCVLDGDLTYCVQRQKLNGTATMTEFCKVEDVASFNMTCNRFMSIWAIDSKRLNDYNPGLGLNCETWIPGKLDRQLSLNIAHILRAGRNYCVMAPHFRQRGIASNCNKFVMANETNCECSAHLFTQYLLSAYMRPL
jgi:hypothetical protein